MYNYQQQGNLWTQVFSTRKYYKKLLVKT